MANSSIPPNDPARPISHGMHCKLLRIGDSDSSIQAVSDTITTVYEPILILPKFHPESN